MRRMVVAVLLQLLYRAVFLPFAEISMPKIRIVFTRRISSPSVVLRCIFTFSTGVPFRSAPHADRLVYQQLRFAAG